MEVIIVLGALGLIAYVIYQALPNTKFKNGVALLEAKKTDKAIEVFLKLINKHPEALGKVAECYYLQGMELLRINQVNAIDKFKQVYQLKNQISETTYKKHYEVQEAKVAFEFCLISYNKVKLERNINKRVKLLNSCIVEIDNAPKKDLKFEFKNLKEKLTSEIASSFFLIGQNEEKRNNILVAIRYYQKTIKYSNKSAKSLLREAKARIAICKSKVGTTITQDDLESINEGTKKLRDDFYYRHAINLIKKNDFFYAEKILKNHLTSKYPAIIELEDVILLNKKKSIISEVEKINLTIDKLNRKDLEEEELVGFYNFISKVSSKSKVLLPEVYKKLTKIMPSIFNRLLVSYIEKEKYEQAIEIIQQYPKFWKKSELLKNLGICCFRLCHSGNLNIENFKIVISTWLTSIFSDHVMLNSLESTEWDDEYTFTLVDSIGSQHKMYSKLPQNVNNQAVSNTNISIGSTQMELLSQFEILLNQKIIDVNLKNKATKFYQTEKQAIQNVIKIIEIDTLFTTPYFAKKHKLNKKILIELEKIFRERKKENILAAGLQYANNRGNTNIEKYASAVKFTHDVNIAIESRKFNKLNLFATDSRKLLLAQFKELALNSESNWVSAILQAERRGVNHLDLMKLFEFTIKCTKSNTQLKSKYAQYIQNYCIENLNNHNISNFKALDLISIAYLNANTNIKICKNLSTIIGFNIWDLLNEKTNNQSQIFSILDKIIKNKTKSFFKASNELSDLRVNLLNQLKSSGQDIELLINESVFSNMSLNSKGLLLKKVLKYLDDLSNDSSIKSNINDDFRDMLSTLLYNENDDLPF